MAEISWQIGGQYYENCNCDYMCPCILQQMAVTPPKGTCNFAMAFMIERGNYGSESLNGLGFVVLGFTPEAMAKGNWSVGLIIDDRATPAQRDAITAIASGAAGGPMAGLSGLIGKFLGAESAPIEFRSDGQNWSVTAAKFVLIGGTPAMGIDPNNSKPLELANTGHPANNPVFIARPTESRVDALGLSWSDASGGNSGLFAPFSWRSA